MREKIFKTNEEWKKLLSPAEFYVLRLKGNEPAFTGRYINYYKMYGSYYCSACDTLLFLTRDQFDAGTGWPTFKVPVDRDSIYTMPDNRFHLKRTEVLCKTCDSHLGYLQKENFTGEQYCINSLAIIFKKLQPQRN